MPFLVEDEMLKLGAVFSKMANWGVHVVSDGLLITGQNPHSSGPAAKTLMAALKQTAKPAAAGSSFVDQYLPSDCRFRWMRWRVAVGEALSMGASPAAPARRSMRLRRGAMKRKRYPHLHSGSARLSIERRTRNQPWMARERR